MKLYNYCCLFLLSILLVSCAGEEELNAPPKDVSYFPLLEHAWWTYNISDDIGASRDSLFVAGIENVEAENYANLDAANPPRAFMTGLLSSSLLRVTPTQLITQGELSLPHIQGFPDITFPSEELILYDNSAGILSPLSSSTGKVTKTFMGTPIVITYAIKTIQGDYFESYTVGEKVFDQVISSQVAISLSIIAQIDIGGIAIIPISILAPQDVLIATNYYAADTGLIFSEVLVEYYLEDLNALGVEYPFPLESSIKASQAIDDFLE